MAVSEEDKKRWDGLHNRLISGDVIASAEIAEIFMPMLIDRLNRGFRNIDDPHLVETAIEDALMDYLTQPNKYNPNRSNLFTYLVLLARSDLLNYLYKKKIDQSPANLAEIVELEDDFSVYGIELADAMDMETVITNKLSSIWDRLITIIPDKTDQEVIKLMMNSVRETDIFADVIGIQSLPEEEKTRTVKQYKDRLKKVIQRHISVEELKNE